MPGNVGDFKELVEYSSDNFTLTDEQGRVIYTNRAVERILGYTVEECIGMEFNEIVHPDDLDDVFAALIDVLDAGNAPEMALQRRYHRSRHRLRIRARHLREYHHAGKLDRRKRRHTQQQIGAKTCDGQPDRQQRGARRAADHRREQVHGWPPASVAQRTSM